MNNGAKTVHSFEEIKNLPILNIYNWLFPVNIVDPALDYPFYITLTWSCFLVISRLYFCVLMVIHS